jgi:beta-N-acetylhexosaminidase
MISFCLYNYIKNYFLQRKVMNYRLLLLLLLCMSIESICIDVKDLTLDQKIGQLLMPAAVADEDLAASLLAKKSYRLDKEYVTELILNYHIGGIIYLGKSDVEKQKERTVYFQEISAIPLLVSQDLEPGRVGTGRLAIMQQFPNNEQLGNINDLKKTYDVALAIGAICKDVGMHINCAPDADVNNNPKNPVINDRAFGADPDIVAQHAIAFARGLHDAGIIACAKHFPGHGDTNVDSHKALPKIMHDKGRLYAIELYPFKKLIAANIPMIMMGHLEIPAFEDEEGLPSSLSYNIVTALLRNELGFNGIIITDALDMRGVTNSFSDGQAELRALLAGNDILLAPVNVPAAVNAIKDAVAQGRITESDIDDHIERILDLKKSLGLLP